MSGTSTTFRGKRLARRAANQRRASGLNLVSLMDIFTILVFFLLVNSAAVEVLPSPKALELPESASQVRSQEVPVVMITRDRVLLQNGAATFDIASRAEADASDQSTLPALRAALQREVRLLPIADDPDGRESRGDINVMADRLTPFSTLKRVMATASEVQFSNIALTVLQSREVQDPS